MVTWSQTSRSACSSRNAQGLGGEGALLGRDLLDVRRVHLRERRVDLGRPVEAEPLEHLVEAGAALVAEEAVVLDDHGAVGALLDRAAHPAQRAVPAGHRLGGVLVGGPAEVVGVLRAGLPARRDRLEVADDADEPGVGQGLPDVLEADRDHLVADVAGPAPLGPHRLVVRRPLRRLLRGEVGEPVGEVEEPLLLEEVGGHRLVVARVEPLVALDAQRDLRVGDQHLHQRRRARAAETGDEEQVGHGR